MEINEAFLEMIHKIVIKQNEYLLSEISIREKIPYNELYELFIKNQSSSSSSSSSACSS